MIKLWVQDEYSPLEAVVLGIATSMGEPPTLENAYDPKSKQHIAAGTYPKEIDVTKEMEAFRVVLERYDVKVFRPEVIDNYNQVFSRDIGCVIDDKFIRTHMIKERSREVEAIDHLLQEVDTVVDMPQNANLEGGDIMPLGKHIFIGYSEEPDFSSHKVSRTNRAGVEFVRDLFPDKEVRGFELVKSDDDPYTNALHLDCCFQPLGLGHCLIFEEGFKNQADVEFMHEFFGKEKCFRVDGLEMYNMFCNVFSIAPDVVVSEQGFDRLNSFLKDAGYTVETIPYSEAAKMEGLLRCSTLPLRRSK
jgi:N-dimethylarginine dimethylaminohydrolase